jgi:hypothetical protein
MTTIGPSTDFGISGCCAAVHAAGGIARIAVAHSRDALDVVLDRDHGEAFGHVAPHFAGQRAVGKRSRRLVDENVYPAQMGRKCAASGMGLGPVPD